MKLPNNLQGLGIPFFTEAEWLKAKTAMEDGHTFHDTYAEFVNAIVQGEKRLRAQGVATVRIPIVVDEFVDWCRGSAREVNSHARAEYAALGAAKHDSANQ
ncbi:hypothetical protein [Melaminivora sp.]|uniref:hypothetical protein n=1 Tax=Melaminivora sp. TaxID=1933032 RepID=UPI0028A9CDEA|nr:hypothetical protein [Melaminivora sp.]